MQNGLNRLFGLVDSRKREMVLSEKQDKNRASIDVVIFLHLVRLPISSIL
jgi:hypothetical protein